MRLMATFIVLLFVMGLQAQPVPVLIKDIWPGTNSSFTSNWKDASLQAGNNWYFAAENSASVGVELWKTDGTTDGTGMVKEIFPGYQTDGADALLLEWNNGLLFEATSDVSGNELWFTDGTADGSKPFREICSIPLLTDSLDYAPGDLLLLNGLVYFKARSNDINPAYDELWVSDGTPSGTNRLKHFSVEINGYFDLSLTELSGNILFIGRDVDHGLELWKTDGTEAGTTMLKDIYIGTQSSDITSLIKVGNQIFFIAKTQAAGYELWVTDGSSDGTHLVKDIWSGTSSGGETAYDVRRYKTSTDGRLLFRARDGVNGYEPWISDGTDAGTFMIKNLNPGNANSAPTFYGTIGNVTLFRADDGVLNDELWMTDGTEAGTQLVKDINPGSGSSLTLANIKYAVHNGKMYFSSDDGVHGRELWATDGTADGTEMVYDLNPGIDYSDPTELYLLGEQVLFFATTPATGRELWSLDLTVSANEPAKTWGAELYPTVSADGRYTLQITDENPQSYRCEVYDVCGRMHREFTMASGTQTMELQGLSAGGYWVRLVSENGQGSVVKMVVVGK